MQLAARGARASDALESLDIRAQHRTPVKTARPAVHTIIDARLAGQIGRVRVHVAGADDNHVGIERQYEVLVQYFHPPSATSLGRASVIHEVSRATNS